jgi:hypothetical protein
MNIEQKREAVLYIKENGTKKNIIEDKVWRSCCFDINPHAVAYAGQFIIVVGVLVLCSYMLLKADGNCEQSSPYIGLVSFILGKLLSSVISST